MLMEYALEQTTAAVQMVSLDQLAMKQVCTQNLKFELKFLTKNSYTVIDFIVFHF